MTKRYISNNIKYDVSEKGLEKFLKDHPNAVLVEVEEPEFALGENMEVSEESNQQTMYPNTAEPTGEDPNAMSQSQQKEKLNSLLDQKNYQKYQEDKEKARIGLDYDWASEIPNHNKRFIDMINATGDNQIYSNLPKKEILEIYQKQTPTAKDLVYTNKVTGKLTPTPEALNDYKQWLNPGFSDYTDRGQFKDQLQNIMLNAPENDPVIKGLIQARSILHRQDAETFIRKARQEIEDSGEFTGLDREYKILDALNKKNAEYFMANVAEPIVNSRMYTDRMKQIEDVAVQLMNDENKAFFREQSDFISKRGMYAIGEIIPDDLWEGIGKGASEIKQGFQKSAVSRFHGEIKNIDEEILKLSNLDPNEIVEGAFKTDVSDGVFKKHSVVPANARERIEQLNKDKAEIEEKIQNEVKEIEKASMESVKFDEISLVDGMEAGEIGQTIGQGIAQMGPLAVGVLTKSKEITALGLVSIFGQEYGGNYYDAIITGLQKDGKEIKGEEGAKNITDAINEGKYADRAMSAAAAAVQTGLERYGAVNIVNNLAKSFGLKSSKSLITSIWNSKTKDIVKSSATALANTQKAGAIEFGTEGGQTLISQVVKAAQLKDEFKGIGFGEYVDTREIAEASLAGYWVGTALPFAGTVASQTVVELRNSAREVATTFDLRGAGFKEANEFFIAAEKNIQNKFLKRDIIGGYVNMTKAERDSELQNLSSMRNVGLKIPTNYSVEAKQGIFDMMMERNELNQKIKITDAALVEPEIERIKMLDMAIASIGVGQEALLRGEAAVEKEIKKTTKEGERINKKTIVLSDADFVKKFGGSEEAAKDDKGIQYLNKDVMLAAAIRNDGFIAAGMHEVLHNVVDGEVTSELAKEFMDILDTNNKEAYDGVMKRLARGYTEEYLNKNPSEYVTQFFSYIIENDVKYEQLDKTFIQKIMDWFKKRFSNIFGDNNVGFKDGKDLYNFILDYTGDYRSDSRLSPRAVGIAKKGENVKGKEAKSKAQPKVSIDVLANQYKNNPAEADAIDLVEQYNSIALAALGYKVGKGTVQPKEAISFVNSQFDSILRRWDGEQKLSTWIYANIKPKKQEFYESEIGDAAQTTSIDDERAQQIAAEETSTTEAKEEKTPTLIDPRILTNVKNKIKEIEKEVKIKKEEVTLSNFKYISDKFGAKVASIIYNIPEAKIKDATKNLTYAKKIINGIPENSEAGNIQNDFSQVDEVRRFLKILPPYNVSTSEATINKQGETIPVSKDVKGRSLGLSGIVQDYFYENYIDAKGEITNPKGRSKGSTSQVNVKRLKPQFRDNISNETIKQLQKDLGITPTGQLNTYNRSPIGQFLKGIAKLKGAITANTIIDQQIESLDIKTAKGKKQVKADTRAGRSVVQFSRADKNFLNTITPGLGDLHFDNKGNMVTHPGTGEQIKGRWLYAENLKKSIIPLFKDLDGFINTTMLINNSTLGFPSSKSMTPEQKLESKKIREYIKEGNPQLTKINKLYSKIKFDSKLLNNASNERIDEIIKRNTKMFKILWNTIDAEMARLAKKGEDPGSFIVTLIQFMGMSQNEGTHINRLGAKYTGKDITVDNWLFEHAVQNTRMYRDLLKATYDANFKNGIPFNKAIKKMMENYTLIAVAKDSALKIDKASYIDKDGNKVYYKEGMGLNFNIMKDPYIVRYANGDVGTFELTEWKPGFSKNWRVPGVPLENIKMHGTDISLAEFFEINNKGEKLTRSQVDQLKNLRKQSKIAATQNAKVFYPKLPKGKSVEDQVKVLENYDKAMVFSRSLKTPEKGISVFDFDDTLAKTNSKVLYTLPNGKTGKLSATEFAIKSRALEDAGAIFDFSQFNKVVGGKKGPLADLALKRQGKFGSKDIFILTARPQESAQAIKAFLDGIGLSIPLDNITGLEDGTPMAKANWVAEKAAKGYNNFYFADDAIKNVKAVKEILDQVDVKSKVQQAKFSKAKRLSDEFNIIIEKKTGLGRNKQYSPARAKTIGASKGKFNFFIPNSAEDFVGLMYQLLGKGKEGDAQMAWLKKNLLDPFNRAEATITKDKISISNDFVELKKQFANIPKTLKKEAVDGFTYEDALRVYIWNTQGKEIPGLAKKDVKELTEFINNNQDLKTFSNELIKILKGKEYPAPTENWLSGTLTTDIIGGINTVSRAEYLQEWQENADIIFSPENMVKLEAAYGSSYVSALKNILKRMKTGTNKSNSGNKNVDDLMNWVNGSVGAIMFLNTRSAVLQTISAINFINWSDNNVLAAGKAFANQPQYWKDFMRLFNSDFLVSRRRGLKINVTESEIADAAEQGSVQGVISMLLKKGFVFTQIADSFAIAAGGSTFYRNRLNKLVKDGMSKGKAEEQAFLDFYAIAEESQQSSRTDRISAQQASAAGRLVLAFGNTPMQYARLIKKASLDLVNGRGDWKTNVSKIVYYGAVQNFIFNALQSALFVMLFDDDDDIPQDKVVRIANGMMDSLLRGLGIGGAVVSTIKNIILKVKQESQKKRPDYDSAALEILKLSPPISSKISKLRSAGRTFEWNAKEINEKGFSLDNPAYLAGAQILSATTNVPLDRVIKKGNNIADAVSDESEYWQKVALLGGWAMWELEVPKTKTSKKYVITKNKSSTGKRETLKRETLKRETLKRN